MSFQYMWICMYDLTITFHFAAVQTSFVCGLKSFSWAQRSGILSTHLQFSLISCCREMRRVLAWVCLNTSHILWTLWVISQMTRHAHTEHAQTHTVFVFIKCFSLVSGSEIAAWLICVKSDTGYCMSCHRTSYKLQSESFSAVPCQIVVFCLTHHKCRE